MQVTSFSGAGARRGGIDEPGTVHYIY